MAEEQDEVYVKPYDCTSLLNEPRPDSVVYLPTFAELKASTQKVVELLKNPLLESPFENVITKSLLHDLQYRTKENFPEQVMFAMVGDMASGKSSVINSILGQGMLARKGVSGGSCTWVVQRFMKMFDDQNSPFAAKVYFFKPAEIRSILKSHLAKYYRASQKPTSGTNDAEGEDDEFEDYNEKHAVLEAFMPLFCYQEEFESDEQAMDFLDQAKSGNDEEMLEKLVCWAENALRGHLQGDDYVHIAASTADELLLQLQPFTFTVEEELRSCCPQPWPLVSVVDFGLDIPILNDGMIFVDTPGTSDANATRARNAITHHRKCNHKIHVAQIGRAMHDKSLRKAIAELGHRRGTRNIVLVLTHGDEIDTETTVSGGPLAKKSEQKLRDKVDELRAEKGQLVIKRQRASKEQKLDIDDELDAVKARLKLRIDELDRCRLKMRNEHTKGTMQKQYKQITGDAHPLPVFIVANEVYKEHQAGYLSSEKPLLTVEDTGIPAIRSKIYSLPADGKLNDALHLALHQLPALINSFELYCSKTHIARRSEIEAIVLQPKDALSRILNSTYRTLRNEVRLAILDPMKEDEAEWIDGARKLCDHWATTHRKKHFQLLKKEGFQKGKGKNAEDICFNYNLLYIKKRASIMYFQHLDMVLNRRYREMSKAICDEMDVTKSSILRDKQCSLMALQPFLESINLENPNVCKCVETSLRTVRKEFSDIIDDAVRMTDHGYLAKAMSPVYAEACKVTRVPNAVQKRMVKFETEVCKMSGVWTKVHDSIDQAFKELFQERLKELRSELDKVFDGIHAKFNMLCEDTVAKTEIEKEQEEELIALLGKAVIQAREMAEGPIRERAEECKNYSTVQEENALFVSSG